MNDKILYTYFILSISKSYVLKLYISNSRYLIVRDMVTDLTFKISFELSGSLFFQVFALKL